ncbi:hypothetical protein CDL12_30352 [Handroanthus impetiginosus]|uniref:Uncharacterized protein n=1 Tax=Handroanthus impetiginosus TaxID=429701 RepID=A0A2G9FVT0_9LAMI|nr:hypothetical protein CDL12_30352 [Handroanthus impetiginosus]
MEQQYQQTSSVDYSLKDGETLVLQLKNKGAGGSVKSKFFELNNLSLEDKSKNKETSVGIKLPPPPAPLSPVAAPVHSPFRVPPNINLESSSEMKPSESEKHQSKESESESESSMNKEGSQDMPDDDFGDFQAAG